MDEIKVKYTADFTEYKKQMTDATVETKKFDDAGAKANSNIDKGIQKSTEGVKSYKVQIREATQAYLQMAQAHGEQSKQATEAAAKVGKLRGEFADLNETIKTFDPNQKFVGLKNAINVSASAFQGLIAAQGLFGKNSEDLQKTLLKVQAAMSLSDSLSSLLDAGDAFKDLKKKILTDVIPSLFSLKGALIATGLGALAVVLGAIIANWDKVVAGFKNAFPSLYKMGDVWDNAKKKMFGFLSATFEGMGILKDIIVDVFTNPLKLVDDLKGIGAKLAKAYQEGYVEEEKSQAEDRKRLVTERAIEENKLRLNILKAGGKETYDLQRKILQDELSLLTGKNVEEVKKHAEKLNEIQVLEAEHARKIAEDKKKAEDEEKKRLEGIKSAQWEITKKIAKLNQEDVEKEKGSILGIQRLKAKTWEEGEKKEAEASKTSGVKTQEEIEEDRRKNVAKYESAKSLGEGLINISNAVATVTGENATGFTAFSKALALVNIGIATAIAYVNATATSLDPKNPLNAIPGYAEAKLVEFYGLVAGNVAAAVGIVASMVAPPAPPKSSAKFKDGVVNLEGPGTETSDSIYARLSRGESVITAKSTKAKEDELRALNSSIMDYENLIYLKYVKPAIIAEKKKTFAENVANSVAFNSNFDDSRIVDTLKKNKPATSEDINKLTRSIERSAREQSFLKKNLPSR